MNLRLPDFGKFQSRIIERAAELAAKKVMFGKAEDIGSRAYRHDYDEDFSHRRGYKEETEATYVRVYQRHVVASRCVEVIARSLAGLPLQVFQSKPKRKSELITEHVAIDVLRTPSQGMTQYDLIEATSSCLSLTADAYWELARRKKSREVGEIYWLMPDRMTVVPDSKRGVREYKYHVGGGVPTRFKPEEIIHFKYWNPVTRLYGQSPMKALGLTLTIDFYARNYNKQFFKQGARLSGLFTTDKPLGPKVFERMEKEIRHMYGRGVDTAHELGVLSDGMKWQNTGISPKDVEFLALLKFDREEVMMGFGVPPVKLGVLEHAAWANAHEQERGFWQDTMKPHATKVEEKIDTFLHTFDDKLFCKFDLSEVEALKESEREKTRNNAILLHNDVITVNEVRRERGLKDVKWGDISATERKAKYKPAGGGMFGSTQQVEKALARKASSDWREFSREALKFENRMFEILRKEFARVEKIVFEQFDKRLGKPAPNIEQILFDLDDQGRILISSISELTKETTEFFGNEAMMRVGLGRSFDLYDPHALKVIEDFVEKYFGAQGVLKHLRESLALELQRGYELGEAVEKMRKRVQTVFDGYTRGAADRARGIARTEMIRAGNGSTHLAWEQSKIVRGKLWLPAADACSICLELGQQSEIKLAQNFNTNEFGAIPYPPAHPWCRCTMSAVIS